MENTNSTKPSSDKRFDKFLDWVEIIGNKVPEPMTLFVWLCIGTIFLSWGLSLAGYSAVHPVTQKTLTVVSLLSVEGFQKILSNAVGNFSAFPPMGIVLTAMLGVGLCEKSGLFESLLKKLLANAKGSKVKVVVILVATSILANAAGDSGFIVMPPLGGLLFAAAGRNPLVGMFCAYASVAGAFSANIIVTSLDVLLIGFTQAAIATLDPNFQVNAAMNYYFQAVSAVMLTIVSSWVTLKFVEPRFKTVENKETKLEQIDDLKLKGLKNAGIAILIFIIVILALSIPAGGWLRDPKTHTLINNNAPLMKGLVVLVALMFFIPGLAYGKTVGKFKDDKDIVQTLGQCMSDMGPYVAISFVIAQFINFFAWSNLGLIIAIKGAIGLKASGFPIPVLLILFMIMCALIDVFVGSASAKWAIMAPIFVPMFMLLGFHPSLIQMAYRIGDSIINVISPLLPYFPMMLAFARKYDKNVGMGTLIANMLPYTIWFFIFWTIQLLVWYFLKLPMGPGAPMLL